MPEHNPGQMGGTMRLGKRKTVFKNIESPISEQVFFRILCSDCSDYGLTAFIQR